MSGTEHRRASAFIGGFKTTALVPFLSLLSINHASRTKFDQFVNLATTKWT